MSNIVVGTVVKFVGGKYNGFSGTVVECYDTVAAVEIQLGNKPIEVVEVVEDLRHLCKMVSRSEFLSSSH